MCCYFFDFNNKMAVALAGRVSDPKTRPPTPGLISSFLQGVIMNTILMAGFKILFRMVRSNFLNKESQTYFTGPKISVVILQTIVQKVLAFTF